MKDLCSADFLFSPGHSNNRTLENILRDVDACDEYHELVHDHVPWVIKEFCHSDSSINSYEKDCISYIEGSVVVESVIDHFLN